MDGYEFVASMWASTVKLGGPAAILGGVYLFRKELVRLLPFMRVKYKDLELSYRLDQAEKEAAQLPPPPVDPLLPPPTQEDKSDFMKLAELNPRLAIMEAKEEVDEAIRRTAYYFDIEHSQKLSIRGLFQKLVTANIVKGSLKTLLQDLMRIGSEAIHNGDMSSIDADTAIKYRNLANTAIATLNGIVLHPPRRDIA